MKKVVSIILSLLITFSFVLGGCSTSKSGSTSGNSTPQKKEYKIGINNFGQANFFARIGKTSLEDEIKKNGGEVIASVTADVPSRVNAIENMISQGVDAIIIEEGDITQVAAPLEAAKKKGIIIGSMDAGDAPFVDVYVSSDNPLLGKDAAEQMMKLINNKGNIVEIYNDAGDMIKSRKNAMHEVVAKYPDAKVAYGFVYAWPDFMPDVTSKMEALLEGHPKPGDISAVFATFDGAGVAASQAIREKGLQNSIVVVGIDGDPEAYKEMKKPDSPFKATMAQDPETIARTCVDKVYDLLNGKKLTDRVIHVPGKLVTKDNIPNIQ